MQPSLFDKHAALEDRHWWFTARRAIVRRLVDGVCPAGSGGTVIDIGAGTGGTLAGLSDGWRGVGLEPSPDALRLAATRTPTLEIVAGADPALLAGRVSGRAVALLMDVLEHVPDDLLLFSQAAALLPAGGHLIVTVPADPGLWSAHDEAFGHYRRYTAERLRAVWTGLPITELLFAPLNRRLRPLVVAARAARRWTGGSRAGGDLTLPVAPLNALLRRIFAGEGNALAAALEGRGPVPRGAGVSFVAVLRRDEGALVPRTRPASLGGDHPRAPR